MTQKFMMSYRCKVYWKFIAMYIGMTGAILPIQVVKCSLMDPAHQRDVRHARHAISNESIFLE